MDASVHTRYNTQVQSLVFVIRHTQTALYTLFHPSLLPCLTPMKYSYLNNNQRFTPPARIGGAFVI